MKPKDLSNTIKAKENRKLKEKRKSKRSMWFGLGMFGIIGWSVVVPTLLGTLFGVWLDHKLRGTQSWTLTFLIAGLVVGCTSAWYWLSKENKDIHKDEDLQNE